METIFADGSLPGNSLALEGHAVPGSNAARVYVHSICLQDEAPLDINKRYTKSGTG